MQSYEILRRAFARYTNSSSFRAAFSVAQNEKSEREVLELLAIVFAIAGSAAPAKLTVTVLERLWQTKDQEKTINLFRMNPKNFIKECARLDKVVPMVTVVANKEILNDLSIQNLPEQTLVHCSIVNANRDKKIFINPDQFNPQRLDLNKILVWNGLEEDILNSDETKRPIRYCPGHDLSLDVIQYVVEQFLPIPNMKLNICEYQLIKYHRLDNYAKLVMRLMNIAIEQATRHPARAIDMCQPKYKNKLGMIRLPIGKLIPSWDEDFPRGATVFRRFVRWLMNKNLWQFSDDLFEFDSIEQAIQWRLKMFSSLAAPNVIFHDVDSDKTMTQLAFSGCACHYTCRLEKPIDELPQAIYVNDMTCLARFNVRKPFERYGAAAYFDENCRPIAIYWSHACRLVKRGEQFWEHVKFVWRSSCFAYITICDHLLVTHMIETNTLVSTTRQHLPHHHRLRAFLKPFTYHTITINHQASISLINQFGLVHRTWAFNYDEYLKLNDYILMNYRFRLLPDYLSTTMSPKANHKTADEWDRIYPIYHDLNSFWKIVRNYVKCFFEINYSSIVSLDEQLPDDVYLRDFANELAKQLGIEKLISLNDLIDVLTQLIACSIGFHELVGQSSDYLLDPRFIGMKLEENKQIQNVQTYSQALILSVVTSLRMPNLFDNWTHLIGHDEFYLNNLHNYENFKRDLEELSQEIDSRNKIRNYPFESFNPKFMDCSTSA